MKPFKWWYLLLFQTVIFSPFYYPIYNYAIKLVIDTLIQHDTFDITNFYTPLGIYVFAEIYINVVWRLSNFAGMNCVPQTANAILLKTYNYVQYHSYKYFTEIPTGALVSKIRGVVDGFHNLREGIHYRFGGTAINSLVCIIAIGFISLKLAAFIFVWTAIFVLIIGNMARKMEKLSTNTSNEKHKVTGLIADCITNIFTLFTFASREREYNSLKKYIDEKSLPTQKAVWKFELIFQITGSMLYIILLSISIMSVIYLKYNGSISIGDIYFILGLVWNFMDSCWRASVEFQVFLKNMGDLKSSFSVIFEENEMDPLEDKPLKIEKGEIKFEDIDFSYGNRIVFNNLNFTIKAGEKIGLVGLSGAGKSTIVNLLLRNVEASRGAIKIDNQDIYKFSKNSLRQKIALIPQDILLFNRNLMENIKYGKMNATDEEVYEASKKANIHDFIMSLENGYETLVGERGIKLSGGQRQRVGIARAILKNAKILLLDEATSSLDSESEKHVQNSINSILGEDITVIAIAHRLATLKHMDRIFVIEEGKITEEGKHQDLISKPESLYKKLWESQKI